MDKCQYCGKEHTSLEACDGLIDWLKGGKEVEQICPNCSNKWSIKKLEYLGTKCPKCGNAGVSVGES